MSRPRIALTVSAARTPANLAARERYVDALRDAGAEVIVLEPGDAIPGDVDGVCFSGGGDIAPERYGETDSDNVCENVMPERDELELTLARRALDDDMLVNSRHHQAVTPDRLAPGLRATVLHDGLVEAFESPTHRWVVGVQWHPERKAEVGKAAARIFDAFV